MNLICSKLWHNNVLNFPKEYFRQKMIAENEDYR